MGKLAINLEEIKKIRYHRYFILLLTLLTLTVLSMYNLNEQLVVPPNRSILQQGDFGHSELAKNITANGYTVSTVSDGINKLNTSNKNQVLVINAPESKYFEDEIDFLYNWINSGNKLMIIGTTNEAVELMSRFQVFIEADKLYDKINNDGHYGLPEISYDEDNNSYFSVTPKGIFPFENMIPILSTYNSSYVSSCEQYCKGSYVVAVQLLNLYVIADNWMFSNKYVRDNSINLVLFNKLLDRANVDTVIFDETHLDYLFIDKVGIDNIYYKFNNSAAVIVLLSAIVLIVPILIGLRGSLFERKNDELDIASRLMKRLETLYQKETVAIPLTIEERFLIEQKLEMEMRGKYYFQLIASDLIEFIEENKLNIDEKIMNDLELMRTLVIIPNECWNLIRHVNSVIRTEMKEEKI